MLATVLNTIQKLPPFRELIHAILHNEVLPDLGLPRAARLPVIAAIRETLDIPVLLLTDRTDHALTLTDEMRIWASQSPQLFFPEPNPLFYENAPWGVTTRRDRLMALISLASHQIPAIPKEECAPIIIAPSRAIMARTLSRREFIKAMKTIKVGDVIQPDGLVRNWLSIGYQSVNTVVAAGQFARRGGILDIWPMNTASPTRLEFFGDEIDTLRYFNPSTQRTIKAIDKLIIPPAREYTLKDGGNIELEEGQEIGEFHIPLLNQ